MTVAATISLIMAAWDLTAAAAGAIVSSFSIGYALSMFIFAWAADHYGAKRMTIVSAIVAATMSVLFGFLARDWWTAVVLYGLLGLAQGGVYTPLIMVLSDEVEPRRRGKAMGWLIASTSIGYATSLAASGAGIAFGGWREAFMLTGILPVAGAVVLIAALHPLPNRVHRRPAETGLADELLRNRETRLLTIGYVGHSWELLGMWAWIPAFLAAAFAIKGADTGGAATSSAYLSGTLHLFGAMAAFTMGRLSDRAGRRLLLIIVSGAGALMSFTVGWLVHAPPVLLIPLAFAYAFVCLGDSPVLTTALSETVRPGYLGAALAWRGLTGFGAGAVAPLVLGLTFDAAAATGAGPSISWGFAFASLGLGGLVALACSARMRETPGAAEGPTRGRVAAGGPSQFHDSRSSRR